MLYVHPNFTTPRGAWSMCAYDFARRQIEKGHRATVVTGVYDKLDLRPTVELVEIHFGSGSP